MMFSACCDYIKKCISVRDNKVMYFNQQLFGFFTVQLNLRCYFTVPVVYPQLWPKILTSVDVF